MRNFAILMGIAAIIMIVLPALVGCAAQKDTDPKNAMRVQQDRHAVN